MQLLKMTMTGLALSMVALSAYAQDIDCQKLTEECPPRLVDLCRCDLTANVQVNGPAVAVKSAQYTASGGRAPYEFAIGAGSIDAETGVITAVPQCVPSTTVSVTDACEREAEKAVTFAVAGQPGVSGTETPVVGTQYTVSGGAAPYTWSFSGGSIDSTGKVTAISGCSAPNTPRGATVTVTDACGKSAAKSVRLPNGKWVLATTKGTCSSFCNDYGMPSGVDFYNGSKRYSAWMYWGQAPQNGSCTSGQPVSGTSGGFTGADGNRYLSLPALSAPYPTVSACSNVPCGGYQGWGSCGVCGSCASYPNPRLCYYAQCVSEYDWVCQ